MTIDGVQGLVSPSDIAEIAGVSRGAVSNWRKRSDSFPIAVAGTASRPLFSRQDVLDWVRANSQDSAAQAASLNPKATAEMELWSALNDLRGELRVDEASQLLLALAASETDGSAAGSAVGNARPDVVDRLRKAIRAIDPSELAGAVDSVLERSERSQGKSGGEHGFVGSRVATLLGDLASTMTSGTLYDAACGIGVALIEAIERGAEPSRVVGHDVNPDALRVARERARLHGVALETESSNVLAKDPNHTLRADVVLLEPPFGMRLDAPSAVTDPRFEFGTPPRNSADTAWLQHAIAHLSDEGRAFVVTPMGTLQREGDEARIRAELLRRGCIEAIVGLPGKMLPQTTIALALWVLRRPTPSSESEPILFIDALGIPSPEESVRDWLTKPESRESVPHALTTVTDVLANGSALTPSRWVEQHGPEPELIKTAYLDGWAALNKTVEGLQNVLNAFKVFSAFPPTRVLTVRDLVDQGVVELRAGKSRSSYDDAPAEIRASIVTPSHLGDCTFEGASIDGTNSKYPELAVDGDVLVSTTHVVRTCVVDAGSRLPTAGVSRLRIRDHDVLSPGYLALALTGQWNSRLQGGNTVQRAPIKDLEVPLMPLPDQISLLLAAKSLQLLRERASHLSEESDAVMTTLLDAIRYNVPLPTVETQWGPEIVRTRDTAKESK